MDSLADSVGITMVTWAQRVAADAHGGTGQMRRSTPPVPYIIHPTRVAMWVAKFGGSYPAIAAAYLHDTIEDTPVDPSSWPDSIREIVLAVTHDPGQSKLDAIEKLVSGPDEAILVKLADRYDNSTAEENGWDYFSRPDVVVSTRRLCEIAHERNVGIPLTNMLEFMLKDINP